MTKQQNNKQQNNTQHNLVMVTNFKLALMSCGAKQNWQHSPSLLCKQNKALPSVQWSSLISLRWLLAHSIQQTSLQLNFFQTTEPEMLIGCFYKNSTAIWNLELENFGIVRDASDPPRSWLWSQSTILYSRHAMSIGSVVWEKLSWSEVCWINHSNSLAEWNEPKFISNWM